MGWAIRAATDPQVRETLDNALSTLFDSYAAGHSRAFCNGQYLVRHTENLPEILEIWLTCWRDVMLLHTGNDEAITYTEKQRVLLEIAEESDLHQNSQDYQVSCRGSVKLRCKKMSTRSLLVESVILTFPELSY